MNLIINLYKLFYFYIQEQKLCKNVKIVEKKIMKHVKM